jgi:hypothetical protein
MHTARRAAVSSAWMKGWPPVPSYSVYAQRPSGLVSRVTGEPRIVAVSRGSTTGFRSSRPAARSKARTR